MLDALAVLRRPGTTVPDFAFISPAGQKFDLPIPKDTYNPDLNYISVDINNLGTAFLVTGNSPAGSPIYVFNPNLSPRLKIVGLKSPGAQVTQRAFFGSDITTPEHPEGILFYSEGANQKVVGTDGSVLVNFENTGGTIDRFAMNNNRQYVVSLRSPFGATVALNGPDLIADRIIGSGDLLDGKIVRDVFTQSINEAGQSALRIHFTNGSSGIYVQGEQIIDFDLSISSIRIAQTVFEPDYDENGIADLVRNKPAVVEASLLVSGVFVNAFSQREVEVRLLANQVVVKSVLTSVGQIRDQIDSFGTRIPLVFTPIVSGPVQYRVEVLLVPNGAVNESNLNNNYLDTLVLVHAPPPFKVHFVAMGSCGGLLSGCYSSSSTALTTEHFFGVSRFLQHSLPIAPTDFIPSLDGSRSFQGSSIPSFFNQLSLFGIASDIASLETIGKLKNVDKVIGLSGPEYFDYHYETGIQGMAQTFGRAAIVNQIFQPVTVHELGHTFGVNRDYYIPADNSQPETPYTGTPVSGYWIEGTSIVQRIDPGQRSGVMGANLETDTSKIWMENLVYNRALKTMLDPSIDPEMLVMSSVLSRNGQLTVLGTYHVSEGILTNSNPDGEIKIQTLDIRGSVVHEVLQAENFNFFAFGKGQVEAEFMPLSVAVPLTSTAWTFRVTQGTRIIYENGIFDDLLVKSLENLRPEAFKCKFPISHQNYQQCRKLSEVERKILLLTANKFNQMFKLRKKEQAVHFLNLLKTQVHTTLSSSFQRSSPLEYDRASILSLIELIQSRVQ